ncbi:MAG: hypothetical protein J2P30_01490 [Actinobacteria bacterium]|nr:hypothetical protein [Actinomycetota bacterium]
MAITADKADLLAAAACSGVVPANARTIARAVGLPERTIRYVLAGRPMSAEHFALLREAFGDGWYEGGEGP